jgi:hypothetical protein
MMTLWAPDRAGGRNSATISFLNRVRNMTKAAGSWLLAVSSDPGLEQNQRRCSLHTTEAAVPHDSGRLFFHGLNNSFTKNGAHSAIPRDALISQELGACGSLADDFNPQGLVLSFVSGSRPTNRRWPGAQSSTARPGRSPSAAAALFNKSFFISFYPIAPRSRATSHFVSFGISCTPGLRVLRDCGEHLAGCGNCFFSKPMRLRFEGNLLPSCRAASTPPNTLCRPSGTRRVPAFRDYRPRLQVVSSLRDLGLAKN